VTAFARFGILGMFVSVCGACGSPDTVRRRTAGDVEATLVQWMECNECRAGELDSVVALGEPAVPVLTRYLREGPPAERLNAFTVRLDSTYQRLDASGLRRYTAHLRPGAPTALSSTQFKATYTRSFRIGYQERAARALGRIEGGGAADSLRAMVNDSFPPAIREAIRCALDDQCRR
jgi:hypothetical protein